VLFGRLRQRDGLRHRDVCCVRSTRAAVLRRQLVQLGRAVHWIRLSRVRRLRRTVLQRERVQWKHRVQRRDVCRMRYRRTAVLCGRLMQRRGFVQRRNLRFLWRAGSTVLRGRGLRGRDGVRGWVLSMRTSRTAVLSGLPVQFGRLRGWHVRDVHGDRGELRRGSSLLRADDLRIDVARNRLLWRPRRQLHGFESVLRQPSVLYLRRRSPLRFARARVSVMRGPSGRHGGSSEYTWTGNAPTRPRSITNGVTRVNGTRLSPRAIQGNAVGNIE